MTDASSPVDREFATRAFVAELATTLVVHEATAGGLIDDAFASGCTPNRWSTGGTVPPRSVECAWNRPKTAWPG